MFRHESLRPFSRGHQAVLFHAREMRRVPEEALPAFLEFARAELVRHLGEEERVLFPALQGRSPEADAALERVRAAHALIRDGVARLAADTSPRPEEIRALATVLHDHVRDEERNLFPLAERLLGEEGLAEVARGLGGAYVV